MASGSRAQPANQCDRIDTCPHAEDLRVIKQTVSEIHDALKGDAERPGYFERVRDLEQFRSIVFWIAAAAATSAIGCIVSTIWAIVMWFAKTGGSP